MSCRIVPWGIILSMSRGDRNRRGLVGAAMVVALGSVSPGVVRAQAAAESSPSADEAAIQPEERARDAAVQKLIEDTLLARLGNGQTIAACLAFAPEAEVRMRHAVVEHHRLIRARTEASGHLAECEVELTLSDLGPVLMEVLERGGQRLSPAELFPQPDHPPTLRSGASWLDEEGVYSDHPGWRHCDAGILELARQAVAIDARVGLLRRIHRMQLGERHSVGHVLARYPDFRRNVEHRVSQLGVYPFWFDASGLCRGTLKISRADLIALLVHAAVDSPDPVQADFTRITDASFTDPIVIEGLATAPAARRPARSSEPDPDRPDWADGRLTARAVGRAPDAVVDEEGKRRLAATAARVEASRQLWKKIESLQLPGGETIGQRILRDGDALAGLTALERHFEAVAPVSFDEEGRATATLGIDAGLIWRAVRLSPSQTRPSPGKR